MYQIQVLLEGIKVVVAGKKLHWREKKSYWQKKVVLATKKYYWQKKSITGGILLCIMERQLEARSLSKGWWPILTTRRKINEGALCRMSWHD